MEEAVKLCEKLIRKGFKKDRIKKEIKRKFSNIDPQEIYEIARCRIDMRDKYSVHELYFDMQGLRYSTPEIVGKFRAERVKNFTVADVSCGVGMQAIFFSFTNKEVIGIDLNEKRIKYARLNAKAYGVKNIRFIVGDALSEETVKMVKDYDVIFSDPARSESEEERDLKTLLPSPLKIMEKYGNKRFIFDLPPQIRMEKIPSDWEKEYISVNGRISRLTTYTHDLRMYTRSAVTLPSGSRFSVGSNKEIPFILSNKLRNYIYIVDESIYYAHLLGEFSQETGIEYLLTGKRRTIATSDDLIKNDFLKPYIVICCSSSFFSLISCLRKNSVGKVTLRFQIDPGNYWKIRNKIERNLQGEEKGAVFKIKNLWIGAKNVT